MFKLLKKKLFSKKNIDLINEIMHLDFDEYDWGIEEQNNDYSHEFGMFGLMTLEELQSVERKSLSSDEKRLHHEAIINKERKHLEYMKNKLLALPLSELELIDYFSIPKIYNQIFKEIIVNKQISKKGTSDYAEKIKAIQTDKIKKNRIYKRNKNIPKHLYHNVDFLYEKYCLTNGEIDRIEFEKKYLEERNEGLGNLKEKKLKVLSSSNNFTLKKLTTRNFIAEQKNNIWIRSSGLCTKCGIKLTPFKGRQNSFEADHIIPFSKGGITSVHNGQALCRKCNRQKSNK